MSKTFISAIGLHDGKDTINCFREGLTSLEGCPKIVEGGFNCSNNKLENLSGAPAEVHGDFNCRLNK